MNGQCCPSWSYWFQICNRFGSVSTVWMHRRSDRQTHIFTPCYIDWNQCFRKFKQNINLIEHKNGVHLKIKKFECSHNECYQRFSTNPDLKIHSRIHSGKKPFVRNRKRCDETFLQSFHLKDYIKIHLCIKKYKFTYNECNKRFVNPWIEF